MLSDLCKKNDFPLTDYFDPNFSTRSSYRKGRTSIKPSKRKDECLRARGHMVGLWTGSTTTVPKCTVSETPLSKKGVLGRHANNPIFFNQ